MIGEALTRPMKPQISLNYGANQLPLHGATVHVWRDEMRVDHAMVVIDGRDRGRWSGTLDAIEIWLEGWLNGRISADTAASSTAFVRQVAIDCVYSARDPKWPGGDTEIDAIIARHR